jgi:hypothetical protein
MNERIKKLADDATSYADTLDVADQRIYKEIRDREFAELIIQDCLTQVAMIGVSNFEDDDSGDISWTVGKCIEMIQLNFDIKNKNVV